MRRKPKPLWVLDYQLCNGLKSSCQSLIGYGHQLNSIGPVSVFCCWTPPAKSLMQGPDAAGHASYLFCNEHVALIIKFLSLQNTSNEDKVVRGILWHVWGYWSIEAGSCVDILCRQFDTTRNDVDLRLPMETCPWKDHARSTLHRDWERSLELADFVYPHAPIYLYCHNAFRDQTFLISA